jgi:hypothetical protein
MSTNCPAYKVIPQIADQVADELAAFDDARATLRKLDGDLAAIAAELDAVRTDNRTDPAELAEKRATLTEAHRIASERVTIAARQAKAKRGLLNAASERALRSPQSIRLRRQMAENFHKDTAARYAGAFNDFRAALAEIAAEHSFVKLSLGAERRAVAPLDVTRGGTFDASARIHTVPHDVDHELTQLLARVTRFPFMDSVRRSIIGEAGYDKLTDWEWSAADFPVEIRSEIANGLDAAVGTRWLRGEFTRWANRTKPASRRPGTDTLRGA